MKFLRWMHTLTLGVKQLKIKSEILGWFWRQTLALVVMSKQYLNQHTIISKTLQELDVLFPVKTWRNLFMPLSPAGWIIVMVSSPAFQRRPLDSCSSSRTLLPGFWLEPEFFFVLLYFCDFKVFLLVYKSLNGLGPKYIADMLIEYKPNLNIFNVYFTSLTYHCVWNVLYK